MWVRSYSGRAAEAADKDDDSGDHTLRVMPPVEEGDPHQPSPLYPTPTPDPTSTRRDSQGCKPSKRSNYAVRPRLRRLLRRKRKRRGIADAGVCSCNVLSHRSPISVSHCWFMLLCSRR